MMNLRSHHLTAVFALLGLALIAIAPACSSSGPPPGGGSGGGGGGGGGGGTSGDSISDMDENEVADFCDDIDAYFEDEADLQESAGCKYAGYQATEQQEGDDQQICEDTYDFCVDQDTDAEVECVFEEEGPDRLGPCDATTVQYFDCLDEQMNGAQTFDDEFTCAEAGQPLSDQLDEATDKMEAEGPACQEFWNNCEFGETTNNDDVNALPNADDNQTTNNDNQTANGGVSNPDGNTQISEMDDQGIAQVCDEAQDVFTQPPLSRIEEGVCAVESYRFALEQLDQGSQDPVGDCQELDEVCEFEDVDSSDELMEDCILEDLTASERSNCHATYDQYVDCFEEQINGNLDFADSFVCTDINPDGSLDDSTAMDAVERAVGAGPRCQDLVDMCPPLAAE